MKKMEVNNEIVLLRHVVRQARVCIVNKLIREAKLLQSKHGNEIQQEKNKRKADKFIAEVYALKTIKNDEISKFGIMNEKEVKDILQDQSSSNRDRIIAKIISHKSFSERLKQFREKFPDFKMYLSEGKKKTTKSKKKNLVRNKKPLTENNHHPQCKETKQSVNSDKIIENSQYNSKNEENCTSRLCETKNNSGKRKKSLNEDGISLVNKKLPKLVEENTSEDANKQPENGIKLYNVTKEATVKRFVELLEEQNSTRDAQVESAENLQINHKCTTVQAKLVDNFFITGSDEEDYQENSTDTSMLHTRFNNSVKTFCSRNRIETQNARFKNEKRAGDSGAQNNNHFKKQSRKEKMAGHKYSDKQSSAIRQDKSTSINNNKINKSTNKNNSSVVNDGGKSADLHPSWLAKKKQQEIMNQEFQGKKIVFADD